MVESRAQYDYLIVGAGAAGCVLANRLSAAANTTVLLIEAGADIEPGREPADVRNVFPMAAFNPRYMWPDTRVHWGDHDSPSVPFPQGRILGGSSTVMGMWALRGRPEDYDEWARRGASGWGWDDVVPFFNQLENDQDFQGPLHGNAGPIPIRREPRTAWSPLAHAVHAETQARGWPHVDDLNADFRDGHCAMPNSRFENSRASSGICYLTAEVRRRPNLHIVTGRTVDRLVSDGRTILGVSALRPDGSTERFHARETLVTAGALRSPVILMRSGIGSAAALHAANIPVIVDRPGVGTNLQNHAVLYICAFLNGRGRESDAMRPAASTYLRWSSGIPGCSDGDLAIYVRSYLTWHALGRRMASLAPSLQQPASRGHITLDAREPAASPIIQFNFLSDERDLVRLMAATRLAVGLFDSAPLKNLCGDSFVLTDADRLMRYNRVTWQNALLARLAALTLAVNGRFGRRLLGRVARFRDAAELAGQDAELQRFIRAEVTGTGHVCGTCRMGPASDPTASCDPTGRVHGVRNLRVADASLMPTVPTGNTHIPTVMVAEKIAYSIIRS